MLFVLSFPPRAPVTPPLLWRWHVVGGVLALGFPMLTNAVGISHCLFKAYHGQQSGSGD